MRHLLLAFALGCAPTVPRSTGSGTDAPAGDGAHPADHDSGTPETGDGGDSDGDDGIDDVGGSALQLDHAGGWVDDGGFALTVTTALVGATVLTTRDGSDPLRSPTATPYTAPLDIDRTTVVRLALTTDGTPVGAHGHTDVCLPRPSRNPSGPRRLADPVVPRLRHRRLEHAPLWLV